MGASIFYRQVKPQDKTSLGVDAPSSFIEAMEKAFGDKPWRLTEEDVQVLKRRHERRRNQRPHSGGSALHVNTCGINAMTWTERSVLIRDDGISEPCQAEVYRNLFAVIPGWLQGEPAANADISLRQTGKRKKQPNVYGVLHVPTGRWLGHCLTGHMSARLFCERLYDRCGNLWDFQGWTGTEEDKERMSAALDSASKECGFYDE
jgi:hypothetical protein